MPPPQAALSPEADPPLCRSGLRQDVSPSLSCSSPPMELSPRPQRSVLPRDTEMPYPSLALHPRAASDRWG